MYITIHGVTTKLKKIEVYNTILALKPPYRALSSSLSFYT